MGVVPCVVFSERHFLRLACCMVISAPLLLLAQRRTAVFGKRQDRLHESVEVHSLRLT